MAPGSRDVCRDLQQRPAEEQVQEVLSSRQRAIGNRGMNHQTAIKTLLICHEGALLDQEGLKRWLASFSNRAGVIVLRENRGRRWRRIKREINRVGFMRFLDVLAFRLYYRLT